MRRLLTLLLMIALSVTNGAAVSAALCEHVDASAHAAALLSSDRDIAAQAHHEEAAADEKAAFTDAAAVQLAGFLQPGGPALRMPAAGTTLPRPSDTPPLRNRDTKPLLTPPLG